MEDPLETIETEGVESRFPRRQALLSLVTAVLLAGTALALAHASARVAPQPGARPAAGAPREEPSSVTFGTAPAFRTTYYVVDSDDQAGRLRAQLEDGAEQAQAGGAQVAPWQIIVIADATAREVFEDDLNACMANPGCEAGALVLVPDDR